MDYQNTQKAMQNSYPMGGVASSNALPAPPDISTPVRDRINGLESWLSDCHVALDMLEKRLDTITTPVPPQPASTNAAVKTGQLQSHVQGRLELLNEGFWHLVARMHALHARIEL